MEYRRDHVRWQSSLGAGSLLNKRQIEQIHPKVDVKKQEALGLTLGQHRDELLHNR